MSGQTLQNLLTMTYNDHHEYDHDYISYFRIHNWFPTLFNFSELPGSKGLKSLHILNSLKPICQSYFIENFSKSFLLNDFWHFLNWCDKASPSMNVNMITFPSATYQMIVQFWILRRHSVKSCLIFVRSQFTRHTVRNLHLLSKNSTLISREKLSKKNWVKNSWKF